MKNIEDYVTEKRIMNHQKTHYDHQKYYTYFLAKMRMNVVQQWAWRGCRR